LFFTAGPRFEEPTNKELMKDAEPVNVFYPPKKEEDSKDQAANRDSPEAEPNGIKVFSIPHEWQKWIFDRYAGKKLTFSSDPGDAPPSAMRSLQILGNDALQMFTYIGLAKSHLLLALSSLTIYSPSKYDLTHVPGNICLAMLPALEHLQTFKLTLGGEMYALLLDEVADNKPFLHACIPPNIEALHFRGPVSMAPHVDEFVAAFEYDKFLPRLKRISFVLDLPEKKSDSAKEVPLEQLRAAHQACQKVLDAAKAKRGAVVEMFREPWVEKNQRLFSEVDSRWAVLDETVARG
jgi:hypothetical protein